MIMVRLKLKYSEIEVLQSLTIDYMEKRNHEIITEKDLNAVLLLDLSKSVFLKFRKRLEQKNTGKPISINFPSSQAVVVMSIAGEIGKTRIEPYTKNVTLKTVNQLHRELFNL